MFSFRFFSKCVFAYESSETLQLQNYFQLHFLLLITYFWFHNLSLAATGFNQWINLTKLGQIWPQQSDPKINHLLSLGPKYCLITSHNRNNLGKIQIWDEYKNKACAIMTATEWPQNHQWIYFWPYINNQLMPFSDIEISKTFSQLQQIVWEIIFFCPRRKYGEM